MSNPCSLQLSKHTSYLLHNFTVYRVVLPTEKREREGEREKEDKKRYVMAGRRQPISFVPCR
jgi:hypothetical protein